MSIKINRLEIENVKRVKAVKMEPSGSKVIMSHLFQNDYVPDINNNIIILELI